MKTTSGCAANVFDGRKRNLGPDTPEGGVRVKDPRADLVQQVEKGVRDLGRHVDNDLALGVDLDAGLKHRDPYGDRQAAPLFGLVEEIRINLSLHRRARLFLGENRSDLRERLGADRTRGLSLQPPRAGGERQQSEKGMRPRPTAPQQKTSRFSIASIDVALLARGYSVGTAPVK
jgi:hypothetical protein